MSEQWQTCQKAQIPCAGCGKMDSCTVSPDLSAFKCWRPAGAIIQADAVRSAHGATHVAFPRQRTFLTLQMASEQLAERLGACTGCWRYQDASGDPVMAQPDKGTLDISIVWCPLLRARVAGNQMGGRGGPPHLIATMRVWCYPISTPTGKWSLASSAGRSVGFDPGILDALGGDAGGEELIHPLTWVVR